MAEKKKKGRPAGSSKSRAKTEEKKAEIKKMQEKRKANKRVIDEIWAFVFIALGVFTFAAVQFQAAGQLGNAIGNFLKGSFGLMGVIFPWFLILCGILIFADKTVNISKKSVALTTLIFLMFCLINSGRFIDAENLKISFSTFYDSGIELESGGSFGMSLGTVLVKIIGKVGLYVTALIFIIVPALLVINTPISRGLEGISNKFEERKLLRASKLEERAKVKAAKQAEAEAFKADTQGSDFSNERSSEFRGKGNRKPITISNPYDEGSHELSGNKKSNILKFMTESSILGSKPTVDTADEKSKHTVNGIEENYAANSNYEYDNQYGSAVEEPPKLTNKEAAAAVLSPEELSGSGTAINYVKPESGLLNMPKKRNSEGDSRLLQQKAMKLEETLRTFKVDATVSKVTQGPAITRYEIQPNVGVKVASIVRLADDIALNLEAKSIRIEAPIPGKAAVGIEVENGTINMVTLREIIDSNEFKNAKSKITFAVGKDIAGKAIVADLKSMPHLLIAGSTGSGKSVCINSIITSILYKANPDEVKLVLVDPKVVELGNYNGIPHLLIPVVTEPSKAAAALNWAVAEMNDRYKKFAEHSVRDLESFNEYMKKNGQQENVLPQVVIIIDELADLMMAAPSQVEESICRLAQMARAAGMHLIVATQRPSVDVITGVIKANIPSRIAFAVSSQFDSRTILDMSGAEKLVGKGDMLFNPLGMGKPIRVQGTFVSDEEVNKVINYVKSQVKDVEYSGEVISTIENENLMPMGKSSDGDELLPDAIECVVKTGQASVSMLQRRFRIGYNRAARIVDMMEERGIVGPQDGSRPRQVLINEDELNQLKEGSDLNNED